MSLDNFSSSQHITSKHPARDILFVSSSQARETRADLPNPRPSIHFPSRLSTSVHKITFAQEIPQVFAQEKKLAIIYK
jgi:hypothetical protein